MPGLLVSGVEVMQETVEAIAERVGPRVRGRQRDLGAIAFLAKPVDQGDGLGQLLPQRGIRLPQRTDFGVLGSVYCCQSRLKRCDGRGDVRCQV